MELTNWSGNKTASVSAYHEPETEEEIVSIVKSNGQAKIRAVGSNMSPNGVAAADGVVAISTKKLDKVLEVDAAEGRERVRTQTGVKIERLLDAMQEKGLTLPTLPATTGMTVGGLVQAGCHGTGAGAPSIDELCVEARLVTADGQVRAMSEERDGEEFLSARCALGSAGVMTEATLAAVKAYYLRERVSVMSVEEELLPGHQERLSKCRHLKYHYMPFTDKVVVYEHTEITEEEYLRERGNNETGHHDYSDQERKASLMELCHSLGGGEDDDGDLSSFVRRHKCDTFAELRELALRRGDPLDAGFVRRLNLCEMEYWSRSQGQRVGTNRELLLFQCGGSQHVQEFVLKVDRPLKDVQLVQRLLR